jgi:hypothetical protein
MPRRPMLPPEILRVEGLSDGQEPKREPMVDDFDQTVLIEPIVQAKPVRMLQTADELRSAAQRENRAMAGMLLEELGLTKPKPAVEVAPVNPGMRAIATLNGKAM